MDTTLNGIIKLTTSKIHRPVKMNECSGIYISFIFMVRPDISYNYIKTIFNGVLKQIASKMCKPNKKLNFVSHMKCFYLYICGYEVVVRIINDSFLFNTLII